MTINEADKKLICDALQIGLENAQESAEEFHSKWANYRQYRHDAMDADVETIKQAIMIFNDVCQN